MFKFQRKEKTETGLLGRLSQGLKKTRSNFTAGLGNLLLGRKEIDAHLMEEVETLLLTADVGSTVTTEIITDLTAQITRKQLSDGAAVMTALRQHLYSILKPCEKPLLISTAKKPYVILMIGVNGAGKTTTIGKLAQRFKEEGKTILLAAGDTFRAAAVEQLQLWGERTGISVIAQQTGADSASVIYDGLLSAKSKNIDVLIADTAGRLHTKENLMQELQKVKKVLSKIDPDAPHETMLVLDAGTGQNALNQAEQFHSALTVTGLTLTKLDGTAKGGIIFAIAKKLGVPIRFIGVGESQEDLQPFVANDFVNSLFE